MPSPADNGKLRQQAHRTAGLAAAPSGRHDDETKKRRFELNAWRDGIGFAFFISKNRNEWLTPADALTALRRYGSNIPPAGTNMTIGRTLRIAFLGLSVLSAVFMMVLAYSRSRTALEGEIRQNLRARAVEVMQQIDTMLFERLQNVGGWSQLDVMQDARIGDVDKRLAQFLTESQAAYGGVYRELLCTDTGGRVIAASSPALIGRRRPGAKHWLQAPLPQGSVEVAAPEFDPPPGGARMEFTAMLSDAFDRRPLGAFTAVFDWGEVMRLLDVAAAGGPDAMQSALLLDGDGRVIAASKSLRNQEIMLGSRLAGWRRDRRGSGTYTRDGRPLGLDDVEIGYATSTGYHGFGGFGWQVQIIEPKAVAFAKVSNLLWTLSAILLLTVAIAAALAGVTARAIALPIQQLTRYTRRFHEGGEVPALPAPDQSEVGELTRAFTQMIAALKQSQEQLVRAGKLAVVGEMAAILAHEVRTPLGIIRSSGQLLSQERELSKEGREMVEFILSETERLNRLITTLIESARPRPPDFHEVDVHVIIRRALELLTLQADKRGVKLEQDLRADPPLLVGDPEQIMQVLLNLVLNAIQILKPGGRVRVTTRLEPRGVVIEVADDGPGVTSKNRERIFDPFVSLREGGIGLGLTVVQQVVRLHRGVIEIDASQWGGALFRVTFPRTAREDAGT